MWRMTPDVGALDPVRINLGCVAITPAAPKVNASHPAVAMSYAVLTAVGVAASTLLVVLTESLNCTTPEAEVDAALTATVIAVVPLVVIGEVPLTVATLPSAASFAAFTAVAVAARLLLVVDVESVSCTAPDAEVDAAVMLMAGVVPPLETIGAVPVTLVTVPVAGAAHFSPVVSAESAVST